MSSARIPLPLHLRAAAGIVALAASSLFPGCGKPAPAPPPAAALEVDVITVKTEAVSLAQELPGRLSAFRVAEVRARINGIVLKRLFEEGSDVKEGQALFEIDPAPYQAALDSARATLARAEANLASANAQAERFKSLVETNAISRQAYDDTIAAQRAAAADVAAGQAAVRAAEINLGYTRVTSPISGRTGRAEVTEGAYVQQGAATLLATVQQLDPLYVDLSQSAEQSLQLQEALASGRLQRTAEGAAKLSVILPDGRVHPQAGALQFSGVTVNEATGSVVLRGQVPNPELRLLPGLFVRARVEEGAQPDAILAPQSAVSRNARGEPTVLIVGPDGKAALRTLQLARTIGDRWLVASGLQPGDQIIVSNLQKTRPGTPVKVAPAAASAPTTPANDRR